MQEFTLTKRAKTKADHLILTWDGGEVALHKLGDRDKVSRLRNWRGMLTVGREIRLYRAGDRPIQADLKLTAADDPDWDSPPTWDAEWVAFWTLLHHDVAAHREQKRLAKAAQVEADTLEDD